LFLNVASSRIHHNTTGQWVSPIGPSRSWRSLELRPRRINDSAGLLSESSKRGNSMRSITASLAETGLAAAVFLAVLIPLFIEPVAQFPVVDFHAVLVIFRSRGPGPADQLSNAAHLLGQESAGRCTPCPVAHSFMLDDFQKLRRLTVGRHKGRGRIHSWSGSRAMFRWSGTGIAGDSQQTALDKCPNVLATL